MVAAGDFKNGITVEIDGNIYQILEFQHVKPGKGAAFVRTKLKNIISGGVVEKTFRPTEKFENAHIDRKDMQYLYQDGDLYNFMDLETYDQIALNSDVVGDALKFVKENETVKICSHKGLLSWRSRRQSRDSREIQLRELQSRQQLRRGLPLWFRCSVRQVMYLRSIHVQASTCRECKVSLFPRALTEKYLPKI